jgi:hypothetical protein
VGTMTPSLDFVQRHLPASWRSGQRINGGAVLQYRFRRIFVATGASTLGAYCSVGKRTE